MTAVSTAAVRPAVDVKARYVRALVAQAPKLSDAKLARVGALLAAPRTTGGGAGG